jgi:hypothetical protein
MTAEEFRKLLNEQSDAQMLGPCLHDDRAPYVFEQRPAAWDAFRDELVEELHIARPDIRVVGSARLGFSTKPWNNLREFRDKSDIDVVIVHPDLFDQLWLALLSAAYPRGSAVSKYGGLQQRRNELYTGWLTPVEIRIDAKILGRKAKPVLELTARWFNALKKASRHPPMRHEDVKGRLYRSWPHAELYHLHSLAELRKALRHQ